MSYQICTLTTASPAIYGELQHLWQCCFGDSELFIHTFFAMQVEPDNVLVAMDLRRVVGAVYMLPASYGLPGDGRAAYYAYALAVLPEYRARGIGRVLMNAVFARCRAEGAVCVLKPASEGLAQYYEGLGMKRGFRQKTVAFPAERRVPGVMFGLCTPEEYKRLRDAHFSDFGKMIVWSDATVRFAVQDARSSGGWCIRIRFVGEDVDYAAICRPEGRTLFVDETTLPENRLGALSEWAMIHSLTVVRCVVPPGGTLYGTEITAGMIWNDRPDPTAYLGLTLG